MPTPIIFVHKGYSAYLNYSLHQAHIFNPLSPIYLITDSKIIFPDFVSVMNIDNYFDEATAFAKHYKHMSTNLFEHELFCFQRWFVIKKLAEEKGLDNFLYQDSDVLLFCEIDKIFADNQKYDFTVCNKIGPQYAYFSGKDKIQKFCDFLNKIYIQPEYLARLSEKHKHHLDNNLPGGVCDMTVFSEYQYHQLGNVKDLSIVEEGAVFDDNINVSDGFEMNKNGIKNISIENKRAFGRIISTGEKIKFNALHFQGVGKIYMFQFYIGNNLMQQRLYDWLRYMKRKIYNR